MIESSYKTSLITLIFVAVLSVPAMSMASGEHGGGHDEAENHHRNDGGGHYDDRGAGHADEHGHDGNHGYPFGEPASAEQATRTVSIKARDSMSFSPSTIRVEKGEAVRFVIKNVGELQHSFTLGTPSSQRQHEKEIQGMELERMASHMADDPNGLVVQPGETGTLTWRFTSPETVQFACHIPGHYPAGMKGSIKVAD